jgi:hypothetical protein
MRASVRPVGRSGGAVLVVYRANEVQRARGNEAAAQSHAPRRCLLPGRRQRPGLLAVQDTRSRPNATPSHRFVRPSAQTMCSGSCPYKAFHSRLCLSHITRHTCAGLAQVGGAFCRRASSSTPLLPQCSYAC